METCHFFALIYEQMRRAIWIFGIFFDIFINSDSARRRLKILNQKKVTKEEMSEIMDKKEMNKEKKILRYGIVCYLKRCKVVMSRKQE